MLQIILLILVLQQYNLYDHVALLVRSHWYEYFNFRNVYVKTLWYPSGDMSILFHYLATVNLLHMSVLFWLLSTVYLHMSVVFGLSAHSASPYASVVLTIYPRCISIRQLCVDYLSKVYLEITVVFWLSIYNASIYVTGVWLSAHRVSTYVNVVLTVYPHRVSPYVSGVLTIFPWCISICQWCFTIYSQCISIC